jgi:hypothetical protein
MNIVFHEHNFVDDADENLVALFADIGHVIDVIFRYEDGEPLYNAVAEKCNEYELMHGTILRLYPEVLNLVVVPQVIGSHGCPPPPRNDTYSAAF